MDSTTKLPPQTLHVDLDFSIKLCSVISILFIGLPLKLFLFVDLIGGIDFILIRFMKITNISNKRIYLKDLRFVPQSQTEGRRSSDVYLKPGQFIYLPDTSEVLRSFHVGDIKKFSEIGIIESHDRFNLTGSPSPGDSRTIEHNLNYPPNVFIYKKSGMDWIDATGIVNIVHNSNFTNFVVSNAAPIGIDFLVKVGLCHRQ